MITTRLASLALCLSILAAPAMAQTATPPAEPTDPTAFNRNVNQEQRIDNGLKDGDLSTGEAARLEKGEAHIDKMEAHDEKTGMTPQEQQQLQKAQNAESAQITKDDNNNIKGNPNSASSQRMQADVQRNVNQQKRIDQGVKSGSLTNGAAGKLEKGQAKVDRSEYRAGRNGHVSKVEQARIQGKENRQSGKIYRKKHNATTQAASPVPVSTPAAAQ
jgi:hypothetical protein